MSEIINAVDNEIVVDRPTYSAKPIKKIDNGKGYWGYEEIGVFDGDKQIGSYIRNYSAFYNTFFPFKRGGKWYALYSKDYTSTRLMELPSCKDLGGEKHDTFGFCPVDYYVPMYKDDEWNNDEVRDDGEEYLAYGFVAGCVWGDDSSWKIEMLDLSKVDEGIIKRKHQFGYIEEPDDVSCLKDAIHHANDEHVQIAHQQLFYIQDKAVFVDCWDEIRYRVNRLHTLYKQVEDKELKKKILKVYKKLKYCIKDIQKELKKDEATSKGS